MKILFVEDQDHKLKDVLCYINSLKKNIQVYIARSYRGGVIEALNNHYDLLLLDVTLPTFDITESSKGGQTLTLGGVNIVKELLDEDIDFKFVIITQFETFQNETLEQIDNELKSLCPDKYIDYVKYNTTKDSWKQRLKKCIDYVENNFNR